MDRWRVVRFGTSVMQFMPVIDIFTDVLTIVELFLHNFYRLGIVAIVVVISNFRFTVIFAGLRSPPSLKNILLLYVPALLLPGWRLLEFSRVPAQPSPPEIHKKVAPEEEDEKQADASDLISLEILSTDEEPKDQTTDEKQTSASLSASFIRRVLGVSIAGDVGEETHRRRIYGDFGTEMEIIISRLLTKAQRDYEGSSRRKGSSCLSSFVMRIWIISVLELRFLVLACLLGLVFNWQAAICLARGPWQTGQVIDKDTTEDNQVLVFIEAVFESLPQFIIQTWWFSRGKIPQWNYALSAPASLAGIIKATGTFFWHRKDMLSILLPQQYEWVQVCHSNPPGHDGALVWDTDPGTVPTMDATVVCIIDDQGSWVMSKPKTYPIDDIRQGKTIGHKRSLELNEVEEYWTASSPRYLQCLAHEPFKDNEGRKNDLQYKVYHARMNPMSTGGLHWSSHTNPHTDIPTCACWEMT